MVLGKLFKCFIETADIEDERLASLEVILQFPEVGRQSYADEGEAEEPSAEGFGEAPDHTLIDQGVPGVGPEGGVDRGEDDRGPDESDHELRETVPDLPGAHPLTLLPVDPGGPVKGDEESDHADQHVLDHLDRGGHVEGPLAQEGAGGGDRAGGVDRPPHPGSAEDLRNADRFDEGGHGDHHHRGEHQRHADRQGQFLLLRPAGGRGGDGR